MWMYKPNTCSDGCEFESPGATTLCHNNDTPNEPNDDTFTVTLNPVGVNLVGTYSVSGDINASNIPYGSPSQSFGPFNIVDGSLFVNILDDGGNCDDLAERSIEPPATCSSQSATAECGDFLFLAREDVKVAAPVILDGNIHANDDVYLRRGAMPNSTHHNCPEQVSGNRRKVR